MSHSSFLISKSCTVTNTKFVKYQSSLLFAVTTIHTLSYLYNCAHRDTNVLCGEFLPFLYLLHSNCKIQMYYLTQLDNLRDLHRCTPLITDFVAQQCFKLYPELRIHQANSIKLQKNISNFKYVITCMYYLQMYLTVNLWLFRLYCCADISLMQPHYTSTAAECIPHLAL